ncbi:hypothetical protein [Thermosipho globiformans]|uniref:hypothetical protein n=1 Tax=Thermosipho globiformans TaxID=380685 RepID=UPI000F8C7419|nr:hypothetical protein [Thermosipho globiformans]
MVKIGVVGYSAKKFDINKAKKIINEVFDLMESKFGNQIIIVSGLTALGIPLLAYQEAIKRGWKTIGIACKKAEKFEQFPVDKKIIIGEEWGDESETFISMIDVLIRIGGGEQSFKETEMAKNKKIPVFEYDL